MTLLMKKSN